MGLTEAECDAARCFTVAGMLSVRSVELLRLEEWVPLYSIIVYLSYLFIFCLPVLLDIIFVSAFAALVRGICHPTQSVRVIREEGTSTAVGFHCRGGKDGRPFDCFIDDRASMTGTACEWLRPWAQSRKGTSWVMPAYELPGAKRSTLGEPSRRCITEASLTAVWSHLMALQPVGLSVAEQRVAGSTPYATRGVFSAVCRMLATRADGIGVLERNRLGRWSAAQLATEWCFLAAESANAGGSAARSAAPQKRLRAGTVGCFPDRYSRVTTEEAEERELRAKAAGLMQRWLAARGQILAFPVTISGPCLCPQGHLLPGKKRKITKR